jgi:hypothetical protein
MRSEAVPERGEETSPLQKNRCRGGVSPPILEQNLKLIRPTQEQLTMRTILAPAVLAALLGLLAAAQAHAYGASRMKTTYVNPDTGQVTTATKTTAVGPDGAYHGESVSTTGPHGTAEASSQHAYSPTMYDGYGAAGVSGSAYKAGVVRYP